MIIRPKSALGLKYVEITRGTSDDGYDDGDTIPVSASRPTAVEFDEFVNMFDDATRPAMQENLRGFGDAFAGRGRSINTALGVLPRCCATSSRSRATCRTPTRSSGASSTSSATPRASSRPPPRRRPTLFVNLDTTFRALDEVARPFIQDSISEGPPTLDAAIRSFPIQRPFLRNSEGLFRELRPGAKALRTRGARPGRRASSTGTTTLRRTPAVQPPPRVAAAGGAALRQRPGRAARHQAA